MVRYSIVSFEILFGPEGRRWRRRRDSNPRRFRAAVFKTAAFDRSATPPGRETDAVMLVDPFLSRVFTA